ncbi:hypothetical protein D0525_01700 [Salmonella enterica]|nr:hypothetical protein D0525_01700 [Salmonella enterica]
MSVKCKTAKIAKFNCAFGSAIDNINGLIYCINQTGIDELLVSRRMEYIITFSISREKSQQMMAVNSNDK